MPPVLKRLCTSLALLLGLAPTAMGDQGDLVYKQTLHGDTTRGVARSSALSTGNCKQCHASHGVTGTPNPLGLFEPADNTLCFACHNGAGGVGVYRGMMPYLLTDHWTSGVMLWPGPLPPARPAGQEGRCLNCHTPHGHEDGLGLVPNLGFVREESLCLSCHDADGPAPRNIEAQLGKLSAHPVQVFAQRHRQEEGLDPAAFTGALRHAECVDCHNPHAATAANPLGGISRVAVSNGAANAVPTYVPRPPGDPSLVQEHELCFKCHSSFTTLPPGAADLALILNPANASFHPVEAPGQNRTPAMGVSLAGGLGLPHLSVGSTVTCSDCHGSESIPATVTLVSTYTGPEPLGPHGSNAAISASLSNAVLRAPYRIQLKGRTDPYARADSALCFICHSPAPFESSGTDSRPDTNFRYHSFHMRRIGGNGSFDGDITTPGSGRGVSVCKECHDNPHGTAAAFYAGNRTNARGVNFSPNVTGSNGTGEPSWSPGSCNLRCHNQRHNPERY